MIAQCAYLLDPCKMRSIHKTTTFLASAVLCAFLTFDLYHLELLEGHPDKAALRQITAKETVILVGSLACLPSKIPQCVHTADSIQAQLHHVFVYLPKQFGALGTVDTSIFQSLKHPNRTITLGPDIGSVGKYVGSLPTIRTMTNHNENVWIFTGDDDHSYHPHLIASMTKGKNLTMQSCFQNMLHSIKQSSNGGMLHSPVGNLMHIRLMDDLLKYPILSQATQLGDQWMSSYLHKKNVHIMASGVEKLDSVSSHIESKRPEPPTRTIQEFEKFYGVRFNSSRISDADLGNWRIPSKPPEWHCSLDEDWHVRSCRASHVCLPSQQSSIFSLYQQTYTIMDTNALLPAHSPPLSAGLGRCDHSDSRHSLAISLNQGATLPHDARWIPGVSIFLRRYCPGNFGHFLLDAILPAFVSYYTMYPQASNPGILVDDLCSSGASLFEYNEQNCEHMSRRLLPLLSDNVHFARDLSASTTSCFEEIVSSNCRYGLFSIHGGIGTIPAFMFRKFRSHVWRRAAAKPRSGGLPTALITFKKPGQRRRSVNMPEVSRWLKDHLHSKAEVRLEDLGDMPLRESVALMSNLFLFITPAGGISISSVFLPPGSTTILGTLCSTCEVTQCGNHEFDKLYRHFHKINVKAHLYPIRQQDLVLPGRVQGCDYRMGNRLWLLFRSNIAYERFVSSH